jgi:hypothetical protein
MAIYRLLQVGHLGNGFCFLDGDRRALPLKPVHQPEYGMNALRPFCHGEAKTFSATRRFCQARLAPPLSLYKHHSHNCFAVGYFAA